MALVDLSTAARLAGVSRQTIYRKMQDGSLSWTLDQAGKRRIDTSEILRVFGHLKDPDVTQNVVSEDVTSYTVRKDENALEGYLMAIESLKEQVQSERERASRAEAEAEFLRQALAKAQDQATKLITDQSRTLKRPANPWWRFWASKD